ncbi:TonB-dependent receptor [Epilithonimonas sp.]|uniref:TonB-dependent receptor n=1 Tax=Epilithonimonas sp. TaxID=2894511 RepID=UPI0028A0B51A|nr:TonB-dependent receptor [Epilithonimonas sp.]
MKKILLVFMMLISTVAVFGQKTISGIINDGDGKPLASASVTIEEPGKNAILAYGISNSKGEYKVTFNSSENNLDLKIKAFNQRPIAQSIKNEDQKINFSMDSQATEIQEVRLKTKLITKKGDTISYDLKSFENKNDRTLADVLKKIPGIEVNKDGTVLYQGEAINKFYVNGKDLMEGGYGTINNSLPKDAVSKVEVLENHQPVSILRDKVPSEQAALNIKLKKSVTITGRGEIGAGFSPLLWNVKLTPMFFGQKNQWVINYKANNNGESVEKEGNLLSFGSRWEGRRSQAGQKSWTNIETASVPDVPEKRYLLNNVHFFSANLLTSPFKNKEWELKANASYTNNSIKREDLQTKVYGAGSISVPTLPNGGTFVSSTNNRFYDNAAKGELIFTKNAKKGFFKNTTTWNSFWNTDRANVDNNLPPALNDPTATPIHKFADESLDSPTGTFQNSLSTIIPWKEKLVNFMSYVKYQKDKQTLTVSPGNYMENFGFSNFDKIRQYAISKTLEVNHSASVGFSYRKWTFTPEFGLNMNFNNLKSAITGEVNNNNYFLGSDRQNDMDWNEVMPYTQVGVNFKSQNFNLNLTLPMNFYGITYKDNIRQNYLDKSKTVFEPNLFANLDFASFFKIWAFANQSYDFGNFGFLYGGNMLTSPTNLQKRFSENIEMPEYLSRMIGSRLEYRNPLNNLFFNVRYNYSTNKRNLIESYKTNGFISELELQSEENTIKTQTEGAEIGKYFPKFKTNLSISGTNTDSNSFSYFNSDLRESANSRQTLGIKFNNTYFSWFSLDYNINLNWSKNTNKNDNTVFKSSGWNHNLAAYIYPSDNHTFGFNWDDLSTKASGQNFRNSFFDLSYQYTWVKRKIDFEFKWLNIANRKVYETVNVDVLQQLVTTNQMYIRPSQFMFTVKFNFK